MIKLNNPGLNSRPRLVSVIIGTYNGAKYLGPTIDSVLAQTYTPLEVIVVDDGSTDDTWAILQSYGDRIVAIRQANEGVPGARNTGLNRAQGEFIALMDHDDLCMPGRLAVQVALMDQRPDVDLCSTEFSAFNTQGQIAERYSRVYYSQCAVNPGWAAAYFPHKALLDFRPHLSDKLVNHTPTDVYLGRVYEHIACGNFVHPPTVLFRARLLDKVGGFEPTFRMMSDWYWLVCAAKVGIFAYIDSPLLNYRRSATQISGNSPNAKLDTMRIARRIVANDATLWQRQRAAMQWLLADVTLDAAYAQANARPALSLKLLLKAAFAYRTVNNMTARTLARALTPRAIQALRQRRREARRQTA